MSPSCERDIALIVLPLQYSKVAPSVPLIPNLPRRFATPLRVAFAAEKRSSAVADAVKRGAPPLRKKSFFFGGQFTAEKNRRSRGGRSGPRKPGAEFASPYPTTTASPVGGEPPSPDSVPYFVPCL
ncbi:hypothetical protein WA026_016678 [Henosepilachna vigintioctopunctata]|uniref:Uncharacterized protein n=1 Tax=Henosepilachna vigintioctopunctata TaxID=420089 RepID=A0AAW1V0Y5_9CUCU